MRGKLSLNQLPLLFGMAAKAAISRVFSSLQPRGVTAVAFVFFAQHHRSLKKKKESPSVFSSFKLVKDKKKKKKVGKNEILKGLRA